MERITVECYAGHRADESPRRVTIDKREHQVARLLDESVEESAVTRERMHRYRILTVEGLVLEVLRGADDLWYLEREIPANSSDSDSNQNH